MSVKILNVSTIGQHQQLAQLLNDEIVLYSKQHIDIVQLTDTCVGSFQTIGFFNSCVSKINSIIAALNSLGDYEYLIYLDSDICVCNDIVSIMIDELEHYDAAFQQDSPNALCGGMFICRKNQKTLTFFQNILDSLLKDQEYYQNKECDQTALNEQLLSGTLDYKVLSARFTTYGNICEGLWDSSCAEFELPHNLVAFHANFTVGIENKKELLRRVRHKISCVQS